MDEANRYCGVPLGSSYCASAAELANHKGRVIKPILRTAWARGHFVKGYSYTMMDVMAGRYHPQPGDDLVFGRKSGGHLAKIRLYLGQEGFSTVEANTSSGKRGSQYNGDGIWTRHREYQPLNRSFYMIGITPINWKKE